MRSSCRPGLAHVIGEGILLLELQEPADLSLLLEWRGVVENERDAFLGLPVELALSATRRTRVATDELARLTASRGDTLFPAEADAFFRAGLVGGGDEFDAAF